MRAARALVCVCALSVVAAAPAPHLAVPAAPILKVDASKDSAGDASDYLFRLGLMEGHLMIGHELLQARKAEMAVPHFGHPVRELYDDVSDYVEANHFPAFNKQLAVLEASVTTAPYSADTEAKYQAMIETLHKAREIAPADIRASIPENIKICADTIDAASGEFNEALEQGEVKNLVEYHDSRGYLGYANQQMQALMAKVKDAQADVPLKRMHDLLVKAEWIVQPLIPPPAPRASVGQFREIAGEAIALSKAQPAAK